jgi:cytidylate kinase
LNERSGFSVIAIDGPAASGKSTVAKVLAAHLGFSYVNSGLMYRSAAWLAYRQRINPDRSEAVWQTLRNAELQFGLANKELFIRIGGVDPVGHLKEEVVNRTVSSVATIPEVRAFLSDQLRKFAVLDDVVVEGRDIGSVVFPETPFKFYIDASPEIRARRRAAQGLKDSPAHRDRIDSSRRSSPLMIADDAEVIDTSSLTIERVLKDVVARLQRKGLASALSVNL